MAATSEIPIGLCRCGCGLRTRVAVRTDRRRGWTKGRPIAYVHGHGGTAVLIPSKDPVEIAWAAGFYEGEGSFGCYPSHGRMFVRMQVSNTNVWTLERFMAVVGAGKIRGPIKRENDKWSDFYSWECQSWRGCKQVAELLWDNLSPRRKEQIELNVNRYFDGGGRNF